MDVRNSVAIGSSTQFASNVLTKKNQFEIRFTAKHVLSLLVVMLILLGLAACGATDSVDRAGSTGGNEVINSPAGDTVDSVGASEIEDEETVSEGSAIAVATSAELRIMQWTLDNDGGYVHQTYKSDELSPVSGVEDVDMNASLAWTITQGSRDIVVGIVDSGIDYYHPDLVENLWHNEAELNGEEGVDDDENGYIDDIYGINTTVHQYLDTGEANPEAGNPLDNYGHGTMVAGVIGAVGENGIGISGVSPKVSIVTCKAFSLLSFYGAIFPNLQAIGPSHKSILQCMDYFAELKESGVNLVATNNSYASSRQTFLAGLTFPTEAKYRFDSAEIKAAIQRHGELDILFVTGAGNGGIEVKSPYTGKVLFDGIDDNDTKGGTSLHSLYPSSFNLPNMISVAGIANTGEMWTGTSYGRYTVDVFAGSDRILSTWPMTVEEDRFGDEEPAVAPITYSPAPGYVMAMGTSFAAPQVVGIVALIKSMDQYADLSAVDIKNLIMAGAVGMDELCDFREESGRHECLSGSELAERSLSGRMIRAADENGAGALTCSGRTLTRRQLPMYSELKLDASTGSIDLEVLNIECHLAAGEVSATVSLGDEIVEELMLVDDGINVDQMKGDGVYSLRWFAPAQKGDYIIELAGDRLQVTVR